MKATLKFDLTDPSERIDHLRALKSLDLALALHQIGYSFNDEVLTREQFNEIMDNYSINLGDILE